MKKTSRRNLLKVAAAGGVSAALGLAVKTETATPGTQAPAAQDPEALAAQGHIHTPVTGPLANATINFGSWQTDPPLDRLTVPNQGVRNQHQLTPHDVTIQAGGTVNFIISGFHQVVIYDDRTQPADINTTPSVPGFPFLIDDPNHRIYRGLNPAAFPPTQFSNQDRVETAHFSKPGTYLVICGVRPHFVNDGMFGFVRVLP